MSEDCIRENFTRSFLQAKNKDVYAHRKKIKDFNTLEKTLYLVQMYLDKGKNIEFCCLVFDTTKEVLINFFTEQGIYEKQDQFKLCYTCFEIKPKTPEFFCNNKQHKSGINLHCVACSSKKFNLYRLDNRDRLIDNRHKWGSENKEHIKEYRIGHYAENRDYILQHHKEIYNPEQRKVYNKKYNTEINPGLAAAYRSERRCNRLQATPAWVNKKELKAVYTESKLLEISDGVKRNVDHIIPLKNDLVCGLHVPWNLQILTKVDNLEKANKFRPFMIDSNGNEHII